MTTIVPQFYQLPLFDGNFPAPCAIVNWRRRSETQWLHPYIQSQLPSYGFTEIKREVNLPQYGRADFTAISTITGALAIIEAKRSLHDNHRGTKQQIMGYVEQFPHGATGFVIGPEPAELKHLTNDNDPLRDDVAYYRDLGINTLLLPHHTPELARSMAISDLSQILRPSFVPAEYTLSRLPQSLQRWVNNTTDPEYACAYLNWLFQDIPYVKSILLAVCVPKQSSNGQLRLTGGR